MAKRIFDILVAATALVLLAPLLLLVALAIKLDSPGPVLFRHERVGRFGVPFRIRKFRTMHAESTGLQITPADDPRITSVGAILRRTKIDELPQLLDVLEGTMSMVGPRPEVPRYVAHYPPALREKLLSVRPGITDPASIEFRHESELLAASADPERTYLEEILPTKLRHAERYVETAGLLTDLRLILRTARVVLRPAKP